MDASIAKNAMSRLGRPGPATESIEPAILRHGHEREGHIPLRCISVAEHSPRLNTFLTIIRSVHFFQ